MRKHVFGRQLQRDTNERKALFKSLMSALVINESIKTTEAKAKSIKSYVEKMVTKARKNTEETKRVLQGDFTQPVLKKFIDEITPRFTNRPGGYTRIIRMGNRVRDNAKMVILEWVEKPVKIDIINPENKKSSNTEKLQATTKVKKEKKSNEKPAKKEEKNSKTTGDKKSNKKK